MIAPNIILLWNGLNSNIPAGFSRETSLDGKYPKAWGSEAVDTTGGSNTHSHTSSAHGHTLNAHSHNVVLNHTSGPANASNRNDTCADNHGHVSAAIGGTSGGSLQNNSDGWASANQEPPYHELIFIKANNYSLVPDDVIALFNSATAPTNFPFCNGSGGTPDLRNKYIKGAATSGDAGGTGGALTHSHSVTHGHTANGHTHSAKSGLRDNSGNRGIPGSNTGATQSHRHTVSLNSTAAAVSNYVNTSAGSADTVEPLYKKLMAIQNTSGAAKTPPRGLIGLWLGAEADIPPGWYACDGSNGTPNLKDYHIKVANTTGEIGYTGGANTHNHSNISHTHVATGTHLHGGSTGGPDATLSADTGGDGYATGTHTHTLASVSSVTATYANTNLDCGVSNNEPAYRTAIFIMFAFPIGGGALFGAM